MLSKWYKRLDNFLSWLIMYFVIALIWVGAEYTFEGAVHSSYVDAVVCGLLALYVSRYIQDK